MMPNIDKIIEYENGSMTDEDTIDFFQEMIDSGVVWSLQGHYGRMAKQLIEGGYCEQALTN